MPNNSTDFTQRTIIPPNNGPNPINGNQPYPINPINQNNINTQFNPQFPQGPPYYNPPGIPTNTNGQMGVMGNPPFQGFIFAGFGQRLFAFLIDAFIIGLITNFIGIYFMPGSLSVQYTNFVNTYANSNLTTTTTMTTLPPQFMSFFNSFVLFLFVFEAILFFLYYIICNLALKGRTIGKALLGLRTVDAETLAPISGFGRILLDSFSKIVVIFFFLFVGLFIDLIIGILSNPGQKHQIRITQKLAKTAVIKQIRVPLMPPQFGNMMYRNGNI
jgi:uncharacterized RDD family membrane protein YckC